MSASTGKAAARRRTSSRDIAFIAIFAGIIAALGVVPAFQPPGFPVPITLQSMGVMLAGSILGARRGFAAVMLFLALVAIGLPFLAGGRGGLAVFVGPTVGFLIAWPLAAFVIGWLTDRAGAPYRLGWGIVANFLGGIVLMYAFGIVGIMIVGQLSLSASIVATWIFIPGDLVKVVLTALIARSVHHAYPGLLPQRATATPASPAIP